VRNSQFPIPIYMLEQKAALLDRIVTVLMYALLNAEEFAVCQYLDVLEKVRNLWPCLPDQEVANSILRQCAGSRTTYSIFVGYVLSPVASRVLYTQTTYAWYQKERGTW
jgi:hypothetical protein